MALATAQGEVRHALRGHAGTVQCVEWLTPGKELASGSADGSVRVWARGRKGEEGGDAWACEVVLRPQVAAAGVVAAQPISRLAALRLQQADGRGGGVFLAAATAGGVTLWHRAGEAESWQEAFAAPMLAVQIPTALALAPLGQGAWALLVGAVDARIHVWTGAFVVGAGTAMEWRRAGALVGHQGWVRSLAWRPLAEGQGEGEGVWVASGSQDGKIRLWRVEPLEGQGAVVPVEEGVGEGEEEAEEAEEEEGSGATDEEEDDHEVRLMLEAPGPRRQRYGVRLEALLVGHEDWVTGLSWHPPRGAGAGAARPLALLSCSMDRSLIIWRPEGARGVWTPRVRLGDLGADLGGAVGGNLLGFLGCAIAFDARGTTVLGHGFGGSMHAYRRLEEEEPAEEEEADAGEAVEGLWRPVPFATGHFEEVGDVQWERWRGDGEEAGEEEGGRGCQGLGRYLVSASRDQTTRLWAPLVARGQGRGRGRGRWHEVSRVQVHGYDLACLDLLPQVAHRLVSGADEKTLRVFDATAQVLALLQELCGLPLPKMAAGAGARVETAYMQALALSTKAVVGSSGQQQEEEEQQQQGPEMEKGQGQQAEPLPAARVSWAGRGPPLEGELVDHTLWPEVAKLYGHGNGLTCLAVNHRGTVVASACKARDPGTARVRLWDTATWRALGGSSAAEAAALPGHQSTVVQLAFSPDDDAVLASVSKDRQVCLYARNNNSSSNGPGGGYRLAQTLAKAHKRIVWSCAWAHDGALLATGSRDGTFKLWRRSFSQSQSQAQQQQQQQQQQQPEGGDSTGRTGSILAPEPLTTLRPAAAGAAAAAAGVAGRASAAGSGGGAESVTAVAFAPRLCAVGGGDGRYLLAVGLDSGDVELWAGDKDDGASWACLLRFAGSLPHAATVKRLRWRPLLAPAAAASSEGQGPVLELASCGSDHAVKIARIVGV